MAASRPRGVAAREVDLEKKKGRQRRYDIHGLTGFGNRDAAYFAAGLDELRERVYDQVVHLPRAALDYVSGSTQLSVGRLMLHLAWGEMGRLSGLAKRNPPTDLVRAVSPGALESFAGAPPQVGPAAELIALCRRVRDEVTVPILSVVADIDAASAPDGANFRGALMHLCWHWIYHSGHIGLLTFEAGYDYEWTIRSPVVGT
jgi:hypothetical protein